MTLIQSLASQSEWALPVNQLVHGIRENDASIKTLKKRWTIWTPGTLHGAHNLYATLPISVPFLITVAPGELMLPAGATAVEREDAKILHYKRVYNFERETNVTTAFKNIIMAKLVETAYIILKEEYVMYVGRSVWEFVNHLLTTYGKKMDDMLKVNLKALMTLFCTSMRLWSSSMLVLVCWTLWAIGVVVFLNFVRYSLWYLLKSVMNYALVL